jgi:hypothetical protein
LGWAISEALGWAISEALGWAISEALGWAISEALGGYRSVESSRHFGLCALRYDAASSRSFDANRRGSGIRRWAAAVDGRGRWVAVT